MAQPHFSARVAWRPNRTTPPDGQRSWLRCGRCFFSTRDVNRIHPDNGEANPHPSKSQEKSEKYHNGEGQLPRPSTHLPLVGGADLRVVHTVCHGPPQERHGTRSTATPPPHCGDGGRLPTLATSPPDGGWQAPHPAECAPTGPLPRHQAIQPHFRRRTAGEVEESGEVKRAPRGR